MSKRVVTRAKFHDVQLVLPSPVGTVANELPSKTKTFEVSMAEGETGIEMIFKGYAPTVIVPYANVQMYVAIEPTTDTKAKK